MKRLYDMRNQARQYAQLGTLLASTMTHIIHIAYFDGWHAIRSSHYTVGLINEENSIRKKPQLIFRNWRMVVPHGNMTRVHLC
jgi:hypothetical protein